MIKYFTNIIKAIYEELNSPDEMLNSSIEHYKTERQELNKLINPEDWISIEK